MQTIQIYYYIHFRVNIINLMCVCIMRYVFIVKKTEYTSTMITRLNAM